MAEVKHSFTSPKADGPDTTRVRPSDWNAAHDLSADIVSAAALAHARQHAITATADHTSTATSGQMLKANANGLPVDATNTDAAVADAVSKAHTRDVYECLGVVIDGGTAVPTTGSKGFRVIPYACTVTGWEILADASGDAVVDVKKCNYAGFPATASIAGTEKPTLAAAQKAQDLTLTTWTAALAAGDILEFVVDSVATVKRVTVTLFVTRT